MLIPLLYLTPTVRTYPHDSEPLGIMWPCYRNPAIARSGRDFPHTRLCLALRTMRHCRCRSDCAWPISTVSQVRTAIFSFEPKGGNVKRLGASTRASLNNTLLRSQREGMAIGVVRAASTALISLSSVSDLVSQNQCIFNLVAFQPQMRGCPSMMRVLSNSKLDIDVRHFIDKSLGLGCVTDFLSFS